MVIDGCRDGTLDALSALAKKDVRVRPIFIENSGSAIAKQVGVENAKHEVIVFLDDDVVVDSKTISGHLRHHNEAKRHIVLGHMRLRLSTPRRGAELALITYQRTYKTHVAMWSDDATMILDHFWGGNFSMRREDATAIGMHNPMFPLAYHEDYDFGLRAKKGGMEALFDPSLGAVHEMTRTLTGWRRMVRSAARDRVAMSGREDTLRALGSTRRAELILRLTSNHPIASFVASGLAGAVDIMGRLRCFRAQERLATVLQFVEQGRGRPGSARVNLERSIPPSLAVSSTYPVASADESRLWSMVLQPRSLVSQCWLGLPIREPSLSVGRCIARGAPMVTPKRQAQRPPVYPGAEVRQQELIEPTRNRRGPHEAGQKGP